MSAAAPSAPTTTLDGLAAALGGRGHAVLAPADFARFAGTSIVELDALRPSWEALPLDAHLRDGGRYRRRRHASFVVDGARVDLVPQRAHWQPIEYNALHGGLERWFEPIEGAVLALPAWRRILAAFARLASAANTRVSPPLIPSRLTRMTATKSTPSRCAPSGVGRPMPSVVSMRN